MRTRRSILLAALTLTALSACATRFSALEDPAPLSDPAALTGTWLVRRNPPPEDAQGTELVVERVEGGTITGRFFGGEIIDSRIEAGWGGVHFAFTSVDDGTRYLSTGVLADGRLRGATRSEDAEVLAVWVADRPR